MKRVDTDGMWSLFDPKLVPHLPDLFGAEFDAAYIQAEEGQDLLSPGEGARPVRPHDACRWPRLATAG